MTARVQWATSPREFVKRAGFVLMACLAAHDDAAPDSESLSLLPAIEDGKATRRLQGCRPKVGGHDTLRELTRLKAKALI